jgi:hypothetical protein
VSEGTKLTWAEWKWRAQAQRLIAAGFALTVIYAVSAILTTGAIRSTFAVFAAVATCVGCEPLVLFWIDRRAYARSAKR